MTATAHHVYLVCPGATPAEITNFYQNGLGLPPVAKPESLRDVPVVWFDGGGVVFHIGHGKNGVVGTAHTALAVPNLEVAQARLEAVGAMIDWNVIDMGYPRFYTRDPWENQFEILPNSVPPRP